MRAGWNALVAAPMIVLVPLVIVKLPLNTAPVDYVNALFVAVYLGWLRWRGDRLPLPLLVPLWLIVLGSLIGQWDAPSPYFRRVALLTTARGVYLYVWFVTLADFFARARGLPGAIRLWVGVAALLGLAALADLHAGLAGGLLLEGTQRAQGTFENPNMFGSYLVVSFFLAWAAAAAGRPLLYLALPALAGGVLATGSNGALMSLLGGTVAALALRPSPQPRRRLGVALVTAGLALAVVAPWRESLADAAVEIFSQERGQLGGAVLKGYVGRAALWSEAVETMRRFPAGTGPGNFEHFSGQVSGVYNSAHNDYLGMLIERGPLGLIGWCALLAGIAGLVGRARRTHFRGPLAWPPLYGLVAAVALHALVVELFHFRHVWLAFAFVAAAATQTTGQASGPAIVLGHPRLARKAA